MTPAPDAVHAASEILRMQKWRVRIQTEDSGRVNGTKVGAADDQGGSLVFALFGPDWPG